MNERKIVQQPARIRRFIDLTTAFSTLLAECNIINTTYNYVNGFWSRGRVWNFIPVNLTWYTPTDNIPNLDLFDFNDIHYSRIL